jgi:hypothetical protein
MDDYELDLMGHQVGLMANPQRTQVAILFRQVTFFGCRWTVNPPESIRRTFSLTQHDSVISAARLSCDRLPSFHPISPSRRSLSSAVRAATHR